VRYLLLLYDDANLVNGLPADELTRIYGEHLAFVDRLREDGSYVTSGPLDASAATQLRRDGNGAILVTDTPLAESREVLGSFYLIEVPDDAAARALAADVPASPGLLVVTVPVVSF
jgi:hypothetical protein